MEFFQIQKLTTNVIEQQILSLTNGGLDVYEYIMGIKFLSTPTHKNPIPNSEFDTIGRSSSDNFFTYKTYRELGYEMVLFWDFDNAIEWLHLEYLYSKESIYLTLNEELNLGMTLILNAN